MQSKAQSAPKTHLIWNVPLSRVERNKFAPFQKYRSKCKCKTYIRYGFRVALRKAIRHRVNVVKTLTRLVHTERVATPLFIYFCGDITGKRYQSLFPLLNPTPASDLGCYQSWRPFDLSFCSTWVSRDIWRESRKHFRGKCFLPQANKHQSIPIKTQRYPYISLVKTWPSA